MPGMFLLQILSYLSWYNLISPGCGTWVNKKGARVLVEALHSCLIAQLERIFALDPKLDQVAYLFQK